MPRREPSAYIWDVRDACRSLLGVLEGFDRERYVANTVHRLAAERLLIVIGEAFSQLAKLDPKMAAELGEVGQIIAFRNVLVHGYFKIDHGKVWEVLKVDLPPLAAATEHVWSRFAPLYEGEEPEQSRDS